MAHNRISPSRWLRRRHRAGDVASRRRRDPSSLWSQPAFRNLWLAATISDFGFHVTALALPLTAAVTLKASPFQMGLLIAVEAIPYVVFGLLAGVLVDRLPRELLMVGTDWARAALLAVIPILAIRGQLSFTVLLAVAFGVGLCSLVFHVAQASVVPALVRREQLADANGRLEASGATAQATGPGLAGLLIGVLSAPLAMTVNALSFAVSGLILRRIPADDGPHRVSPTATSLIVPDAPPPPVRATQRIRNIVAEIAEGLRILFGQPILRGSLLASSIINLFGYVFLSVYIIFMARTLGLSEVTIGLILSGGGAGAVVGAVVSEPLRRRFGFGPTMVWAMLVCSAASVLIPLALVVPVAAVPLLLAAETVQYGALATFNIGGRTLRQVYTADRYQGRVNATARTLASTGTLAGSLGGGLLGSWLGLGPTLVIGAVGMMLAFPFALFSPLPRLRALPAREEATGAATAAGDVGLDLEDPAPGHPPATPGIGLPGSA